MSESNSAKGSVKSRKAFRSLKAKLFGTRPRKTASEPEPEPEPEPPQPTTIKEFEALAWSVNADRLCDICSPELYTSENCLIRGDRHHLRFHLHKDLIINKYGYTAYRPLDFGPNGLYKAEVMHLARTAIQYFDRPWEYLNDQQLLARENLLRWIDEHPVREPSNEFDGEKLISDDDMTSLLKWFSELFFGGKMSRTFVEWTTTAALRKRKWVEEDERVTGLNTWSLLPVWIWKICMVSDDNTEAFEHHKMLGIISTLIHEATHVFLEKYGCHWCEPLRENQQAGCHGRPWQLISAALEDSVPRLLGIPFKSGRFFSSLLRWSEHPYVPSRHDMAVYKFSKVQLWSDNSADVRNLIDCTSKMCSLQPCGLTTTTTRGDKPFVTDRIYDTIPEWIHETDDSLKYFCIGR